MPWINNDGLRVKFGAEEGHVTPGGNLAPFNDEHVIEVDIAHTEMRSATYAIVGSVAGSGQTGVKIPAGARIKKVEVYTMTAFTSSGTIATSTFSLGLKKQSDFSTELDHDGLLTVAFVGSNIDAVGETTEVKVGSTGAGALLGTTLAENGVLVGANTQHASHPFTAGVAKVRIWYHFPA